MDGTAGRTERQVAIAGLLIAVCLACATVQLPPGGPPDFDAPTLLATVPESSTVVPRFDDEVEFRFDEVVDERSGGNLENLIRISPRHDDVRVSWRRSRVTVKPGEGWRPSETYTVTLLPGIADLRQNRLDSATTIVFSTGNAIPATGVTGNVIDWPNHRMAAGALVELIRPSDSVTYLAVADTSGAFSISGVPPGQYVLVATIDESRNQRRERREAFDSTLMRVDSVASFTMWAFPHDTTGPNVRTTTFVDSLAVSAEFTQYLAPTISTHSARILRLPDSTPVAAAELMWQPAFDSLRTAQRDSITAVQDSIAGAVQDSIAAALRDSLAAAGDSVAADSLVPDSIIGAAADSATVEPGLTPADSTEVSQEAARREALLQSRPRLYNTFVIVVGVPLEPGETYLIEATVANLLGFTATSSRSLLIPTPPDST